MEHLCLWLFFLYYFAFPHLSGCKSQITNLCLWITNTNEIWECSTVTFINQATLCRAFFFPPPKYNSHKSCAIFHINLYVFNIHTEISNGTNKLYHVKRLAVFQNKPFWIPYGRMNHLCHHCNKRMLTIVQNTFTAVVLDDFFSLMKGLSLTNWLPFPSFFGGLGVTNNAAKPNCVVPTGDNGSLYEDHSSGKLIVIKINETQFSWMQQLIQKCKHRQSHFDFLNNVYWVSLF